MEEDGYNFILSKLVWCCDLRGNDIFGDSKLGDILDLWFLVFYGRWYVGFCNL